MAHENTAIRSIYVHGGGEATDEMNDLWPPEAKQQERAHYACMEDQVNVEFDLDTGNYRYVGFAGKKLEEPTQWFGG